MTQKATGASKEICHLAKLLSASKHNGGALRFAWRILQSLDSVRLGRHTLHPLSYPAPGSALPSQSVRSLHLVPNESVEGESTSIPQLLGDQRGDPDLNS